MSDKQTLRRRNRAAARATARTKTVDSIEKEGNSSTSGSSSPTRSNASVSPPSDLPKPMPSYGSLDMLGQAKSVESNPYGQTILNAYLYQQGEQLGFFLGVNGTVRELYYYCIPIQKASKLRQKPSSQASTEDGAFWTSLNAFSPYFDNLTKISYCTVISVKFSTF